MICVSLQTSLRTSIADLEQQITSNLGYTSLFEFRLNEHSLALIPWILRPDRPYRAIITLQSAGTLPESDRIAFLKKALQDGANWIDWNQPTRFPSLEQNRILYSYHDWKQTPSLSTIEQLYQERKHPESSIKLVFQANCFSDNLTIRSALRKIQDPKLISFCMGERGQTSRILACLWGSAWTYAAPDPEKKTAPGQFTAHEMICTYQHNVWQKEPSAYFGILGSPVQKSLSPLLHNIAFQDKAISALYLPVETLDPLSVLNTDFFQGFSVTMPFKEQLCGFPEMISFSSEVQRWKSLNTLLREGTRWRAENTDAWAALALPSETFFDGSPKRVVVWGSGGVARSVALALAEKGCVLVIQARNEEKGRALAQECRGTFLDWDAPILEPVDLLIQGTPVGMEPHTQQTPASLDLFRGGLKILMETIYRPTPTLLMQQASAKGISVISGLDFFMQQAYFQQVLMTGSGYPLERWKEKILLSL